jgi:polyisoprenoid-binding protein YceI
MEEAMNLTPATVAIPGYLAGTWKADPAQCEIGFAVRLLTVGKVGGRFTNYDVTVVTSRNPLGSSVAAEIGLASVDTGNERPDDHLRSADFFQVETYPTMSYHSTGIRQVGHRWIVDGQLTLHGVTRQVPLDVEANGFGPAPNGGPQVGFTATAQINRGDFGIHRWSGGGAMIGDKVPISLKIQAALRQ